MFVGHLGPRPLRVVLGQGATLYARAAEGRAPDTHRSALAVARQWAAWCVRQRWLRENPFARVEPIGRKRRGADKPQLRVDEARRLLEHCLADPSPASTAVIVALVAGLRASEIAGLQCRDVDDAGRLIWITDSKTRAGRRHLEVPDFVAARLAELAADRTGPLYLDEAGEPATRWWVAYHCRRLCDAARVPVVSPHALRRTHATLAIAAGASSHVVAGSLGHASTAITARAYVEPSAARAASGRAVLRVIDGGSRGNSAGNSTDRPGGRKPKNRASGGT